MANRSKQFDHSGLSCPECGSGLMGVVDSRPGSGTVRRRRRCGDCGFRITTHEVTDFEKRLLDEWVKRIAEVRELVHGLLISLDSLDSLEGGVRRSAQGSFTMRDLTSGDRPREPNVPPGTMSWAATRPARRPRNIIES